MQLLVLTLSALGSISFPLALHAIEARDARRPVKSHTQGAPR
jgi:hypothetical protein